MKRILLLSALTLSSISASHAQSVLFSEQFEGLPNTETSVGLNQFILGTCAGNGPTETGTIAAYIAPNLDDTPNCSIYSSSFNGLHTQTTTDQVTIDFTVMAACAQNLNFTFDYRKHSADLTSVYYKVLGQSNWTLIENLTNSSNWTSHAIALPSSLSNQNFELRFQVNTNTYNTSDLPLAIDNLKVTGTLDASPAIVCPPSYNYNLGANCSPILPDLTGAIDVEYICPAFVTFTQSPPAGTLVAVNSVVTITMTDAQQQTSACSFNANAVDMGGPMITCPPTIVQAKDANCEAVLLDHSALVHGIDNCSSWEDVDVSFSIPVGTPLTNQATIVVVTATDDNNNTSTCQFTVELVDQTPPTLTNCPASVNAYRNVNCEVYTPNVINDVVAADNCTASSLVFISQHPGVNSPAQNFTEITITATDENNNQAFCVVQLHIVDTISPIVDCTTPVMVTPTNGCDIVVPDLQQLVTYSDNCTTANFNFTQSTAVGSIVNGQTSVLISVTDESNNTTNCVVTILPIDTEVPTITCPGNLSIVPNSDCEAPLGNYITVSPVLDNCSNFTINQEPAPGTLLTAGEHTVTMTVTDIGNNTATCTFTVSIEDNLPATITCPPNMELCETWVEYDEPTVSGTCNGSVSNISSHGFTSGMDFPIGTTTMIYTVEGAANAPQCSFLITIADATNVAHILQDSILLCNESSVTLQAQADQTGLWTQVGSSSAQIQAPNEALTGINGLSVGQYRFVWTVDNGICGISRDTILVINSQPAQVVIGPEDVYACNNNYQTVSAAITTGGGTWTANTGALFINSNLNQTSVYNMSTGWNTLYFTSNPIVGCPASVDSMRIFRSGELDFPALDSTYCFSSPMEVEIPAITVDGIDETTWSALNFFIEKEEDIIRFSNLHIGTNLATLTINYSNCPTRVQTVEINVANCANTDNSMLSNIITPNGDGKNDEFNLMGLDQQYPMIALIIHDRWGNLIFEGVGSGTYWDGTNKSGDKVPFGVYYYSIILNDADQQIIKGSISVMY